MEILWNFSVFMEPVALIPQAYMYRRYRTVENLTGGTFLSMMGGYRGLYVLNWIYRAHTEPYYRHHYVVYVCGIFQVLVAWGSVVMPSSEGSSSAPLVPQVIQLCRDCHLGWWFFLGFTLTVCVGGSLAVQETSSTASADKSSNLLTTLIPPLLCFPFWILYLLIARYKDIRERICCGGTKKQGGEDKQDEEEAIKPKETETDNPPLLNTDETHQSTNKASQETKQGVSSLMEESSETRNDGESTFQIQVI